MRIRFENEEQGRGMQEMGEKLTAKDQSLATQEKELAQLRKEARPGVEVCYVEEGVTRIEGAGQGEPAAKRLTATQESSSRSYAELGAQFNLHRVQVKKVPPRGLACLISPDRTPNPLKSADLNETVDAAERFVVQKVCSVEFLPLYKMPGLLDGRGTLIW